MISRGLLDEADCPAINSYQRLTKPLIEKRRRARINLCLMQLKDMVIDSGRHNIQNPKCKYEKADILELTVEYLQNLHLRQEMDTHQSRQSYNEGFEECLKQVQHFMKCIPLSEKLTNGSNMMDYNQLSDKLLNHLEFCKQELTHKEEDNQTSVETVVPMDSTYFDRNLMTSNSFSVIQHTRDYSSSISSASSTSSARTIFSPPSSPEPTHRTLTHSTRSGSSTPPDLVPDMRPLNINAHTYELGDDVVWRPWSRQLPSQ